MCIPYKRKQTQNYDCQWNYRNKHVIIFIFYIFYAEKRVTNWLHRENVISLIIQTQLPGKKEATEGEHYWVIALFLYVKYMAIT